MDGGAVLVTGASSGIGEACALRLDRRGFAVYAGVRKDEDAERLRSAASERLRPVMLDVADGDSIAAAFGEIGEGSALAGLVNNAGVTMPGPVEFLPLDELRHQLEVNLVGQVAVTQAAIPLLRRAPRARIVNMGSIGGRVAQPFISAYGASKHALEAVTDSLRIELGPWGIDVSIVEPGTIATPIWEKGTAAGDDLLENAPPAARELYGERIAGVRRYAVEAAKRGLPPDAVARAVEHALTARRPRTRYVVGREARLMLAVSGLVPDRAWDAIVARILFRG